LKDDALPVLCAGCGELLDAEVCRFCGEDHSAAGTPDLMEVDPDVELDRLQPWSQIKHEIIEKYAAAYTRILSQQKWVKRFNYYDAFAGAGVAMTPESEDFIPAGALRALQVEPPFSEYHFIELNERKAEILQHVVRDRPTARVHQGDYRDILPGLLQQCRFENYARGLCLLDPYGLSVDYALLVEIAKMKSVEIFFNFMLVAANRNVLWKNPDLVSANRRDMMTRVWGDEAAWREAAYDKAPDLFGEETLTKVSNDRIIAAYRQRLKDAGFAYVPEPIAMKNSHNAPLYYLFFCSPKAVAAHIVTEIFAKYR
jgi:three-Cys-motif partner protein